jgi:hypothetical protein
MTMSDLNENEERFLVTLLTRDLFLSPVLNGLPRVSTSDGDLIEQWPAAQSLEDKGLISWRPFRDRLEASPIELTPAGRTRARELRAVVEPMQLVGQPR